MDQLLKKLKTAPVIKTEESEESRLKYLEEIGLNDIVNKGLVELYRVQPENPITFLASFLINEDNAKKIIESIDKSKETKINLLKKQQEENEYKTFRRIKEKRRRKRTKEKSIKRRNKIL